MIYSFANSNLFCKCRGKDFRDREQSSFLREKTFAIEDNCGKIKGVYAFTILLVSNYVVNGHFQSLLDSISLGLKNNITLRKKLNTVSTMRQRPLSLEGAL